MIAWLAFIVLLAQQPSSTQEGTKNHAVVRAVFVDGKDKPVAGVAFTSRVWPGAEFEATSDPSGKVEARVEWASHKDGTWYQGVARAFGYAKWEKRGNLEAGEELDLGRIQLAEGGALSGRILAESGTPLVGAHVRVIDANQTPRPEEFVSHADSKAGTPIDSATSEEGGLFRVVGVPPGKYWLVAKHETTWRQASATITVAAGADVAVDELWLEPLPDTYRIEGTVLDPQDKPVSGAEVSTSVRSEDGRALVRTQTRTEQTGRFVLYLARLPGEPVDLRVEPPGDQLDEASLVGVRPGARDVVVKLGGMRRLHLLVLDSAGKPVETFGWSLQIERSGSTEYTGEAENRRPSGRATIAVPDTPVELEVRAPGFNQKEVGRFSTGALPEVVEVKLDAPQGVEGSVSHRGAPVPDCYVELVAQEPDYLDGVLGERWSGLYYGWKGTSARTDAQGRFMIPSDFPHMRYFVRAWKEGHAEAIAGPVKVGDAPVEIELGTGGAIRGEITLPPKLSPAGIEVEVYRKARKSVDLEDHVGTEFTSRVGPDGNFLLDPLAPGPWLLHLKIGGTVANGLGFSAERAAAYESIPWVVEVVEGEETLAPLDLSRDEPCQLEGRIHVGDKVKEGYCTLQMEGPIALDVAFGGIEKGGEGKFTLATRTPGKYRVVIHAGPGHYQYKVITDLVDLVPGPNVWEKDLPADQWAGKGIRLDRP